MPTVDLTGDEHAVVMRALRQEAWRQVQLADLELTKRNPDRDAAKHYYTQRDRLDAIAKKIDAAFIATPAKIAGHPGATVTSKTAHIANGRKTAATKRGARGEGG